LTLSGNYKVLLIGYGNPAREDDGLGPAAAQAIEKLGIEGVSVDSNYQLTVEDAASAAHHDVVVFVDATTQGKDPVVFYELEPKRRESFTSHSVEPEAILALTHDLFNAETRGFMLGIRGYSFDMFKEEMTTEALNNLETAVKFITPLLKTKSFEGLSKQEANPWRIP
jgi:hydrogenase maturation protease